MKEEGGDYISVSRGGKLLAYWGKGRRSSATERAEKGKSSYKRTRRGGGETSVSTGTAQISLRKRRCHSEAKGSLREKRKGREKKGEKPRLFSGGEPIKASKKRTLLLLS